MHFNWGMVVPFFFHLYIYLATLNRRNKKGVFAITPET